jgi:general secretion pathway protein J
LIEVMVSLMILSVMSIMAWQGLDGMVRARDITEGSVKRTLRLQSVMKQWEADMLAVVNVNTVPPLSFNGATVRLTRRSQGGAQVVVWTLRKGRWIRWAGPPVATVGPLLDQWEQSQHIRGVVPGALVALAGVQQWQVQYFRNGNWTNAQSTGDQVPTLAQAAAAQSQGQFGESLPMGVRCLLSLGEGSGFTGRITRDVQLAPQPGQQ